MNQSYSTIERMLETGDGCISRKAAIANGVAPASFARYVRSHGLIKIRCGVYTKEIGAIDDLFQLQKRYPKIVYSGITALYLLGLTDRIPESVEFSIPKGSRVRKENVGFNAICHIENNIKLFELGNTDVETMFGNVVICFSKEKMVVEMIRKRNDYDSELFLKAVKSFLKGKDKDLDFLFQYARMRKIGEKVYQVLEAMDYENK